MLIIEHTVESSVIPQAIWDIYADHEGWTRWDHGLEEVHLAGPFEVGTKGRLKPKGGPWVEFEVKAVEPLISFTDVSYLPCCQLIFTHHLARVDKKTRVTHRVEMKGFLSFFFAFMIGRGIKADMPTVMEKLVRLAEEKFHEQRA